LKINAKKHIVELQKDRDLWKDCCTQMVRGIGPMLDLLDLGLPPKEPRVQQQGIIDKCQLAWHWLQQFVKEAEEFAGAHVLSMVRAHYPLIDFTRFAKGYPKEVGVQ
jgi:hypothetical protein